MITDKNKEFLARYGSENHIDHLMKTDNDLSTQLKISQNPSLKPKHAEILSTTNRDVVLRTLARRKDLTDKSIKNISKTNNEYILGSLAENPATKDENLDNLISKGSEVIGVSATKNPNLKENHIDKLLDLKKRSVNLSIASNAKLNDELFHEFRNTSDFHLMKALSVNPNLSHNQIDNLIDREPNHLYWSTLYWLTKNHSIHPNHIDKILDKTNNDWEHGHSLLSHPKLTENHFLRIAKNKHGMIQSEIKSHPLYEKMKTEGKI